MFCRQREKEGGNRGFALCRQREKGGGGGVEFLHYVDRKTDRGKKEGF